MSSTVQMVQCSDTKPMQPVTTLKSLKDPNFLLDNTSMRSQRYLVQHSFFIPFTTYLFNRSPNNSLYQLDTGGSGIYARPKPPPYKGGTLGRNGVDI